MKLEEVQVLVESLQQPSQRTGIDLGWSSMQEVRPVEASVAPTGDGFRSGCCELADARGSRAQAEHPRAIALGRRQLER